MASSVGINAAVAGMVRLLHNVAIAVIPKMGITAACKINGAMIEPETPAIRVMCDEGEVGAAERSAWTVERRSAAGDRLRGLQWPRLCAVPQDFTDPARLSVSLQEVPGKRSRWQNGLSHADQEKVSHLVSRLRPRTTFHRGGTCPAWIRDQHLRMPSLQDDPAAGAKDVAAKAVRRRIGM